MYRGRKRSNEAKLLLFNFIWFKLSSSTTSETKERNNLDTLYMYVR